MATNITHTTKHLPGEHTDLKTPSPTTTNGVTVWRLPGGVIHREGAPAVIMADGGFEWRHHHVFHREGGPAIFDATTGVTEWYRNGFRHRVGAPAIYREDGTFEWWLWGDWVSESEAVRAGALDLEELAIANGLAENWSGTTADLLDTAVLLAAITTAGQSA